MKIAEIKKKMLTYRDFYGGDMYMNNEIQEATSKKELAEIIETYRTHLECMLCDAHSHLDNFKKIVDKQSILELKIKSIQSQQNKEK